MSGPAPTRWTDLDPFDLPEWLGVEEVVWVAGRPPRRGEDHRLGGELRRAADAGAGATAPCGGLACEVLAIDEAYPQPVMDDDHRVRAHQAWRHGSIVVLRAPDRDETVVVAVPGRRVDPLTAVDALTRLARAVGADPVRWSAQWRLGGDAR